MNLIAYGLLNAVCNLHMCKPRLWSEQSHVDACDGRLQVYTIVHELKVK